MKKLLTVAALLLLSLSVTTAGIDPLMVKRGDANDDGVVDISDASAISNYIQFNKELPCLNQADVNDDGVIGPSDITYLVSWLYLGGDAPPKPGPFADECSEDEAPYPGCDILPAACN